MREEVTYFYTMIMVIYQYGASDQMIQKYRYDADNRLQQVHTSTDGYVWNKEAMYKYYAHGPLSRIELGQHRVQGLDYYYTLQGWLKGVNGSTEGNDPGQDGMGISRVSKDAFAFALGYFEGDYQGIGATPTTNQLWTRLGEQQANYKGLYNGNIAWMQTDLPGLQDKPEQAMLYRYDQLNRLVLAQGLNQFDAATGFAARSGSTGPYDAAYSYDPNGNLLSLDRHKQDGSLLDEFDYSYTPNTNRLASVEDASVEMITYDEKIYSSGAIRHDGKVYRSITVKDNATAEAGQPAQLLQANESITLQPSFHAKAGSGFHAKWTTASNTGEEISEFAYEYDAIGNLTHDRGEGTNITWTPYGKVRTVSKGDGTAVSYQYDAAGNRISKTVTSNSETKTTHYVRDVSGNVLSIYQDEALQEQPIYGSSRLGMYRPKDSKADGSLSLGQRHYELSNHLGNVLSVITDEVKINADGLREPVILQQQDYFGFGLAMEGRSWQSEDYKYRHGFNGKEKDTDFQNNYDFGARLYNSKLGRWLSTDPLSAKYPFSSPYNFALNTPIQAIDPDGRLVIFVNGYKGASALATDIFDNGLIRGVYRLLSSEKIYKTDINDYWGNIDDNFIDQIGDKNIVYADASSHMLSTASYRYGRGKEAGEAMIKQIKAGDIKLQTDEKGNVTETIKIVSHSQGSAYAAGISNVLTDAGYKVEVEYNIAPKQPGDIPETKASKRVQYGSDRDIVADQEPMPGNVEDGGGPRRDGKIEGHFLENYDNIFKIGKNREGYVAPRQDKPVKENSGGIFGIVVLIMIFFGGCKSEKEQLKCLEEKIMEHKGAPSYESLKTAVSDSIKRWADLRLKNTDSYKPSNSEWKVDEIILNEDSTKLFGWLLQVSKDSGTDVLDYVEYFAGEKVNEGWYFYIHHMPSLWFDRENNDTKPYSFEYLSHAAKLDIMDGGIFKKGTCKMNYEFINNRWFDRGSTSLYELHKAFLKSGSK